MDMWLNHKLDTRDGVECLVYTQSTRKEKRSIMEFAQAFDMSLTNTFFKIQVELWRAVFTFIH